METTAPKGANQTAIEGGKTFISHLPIGSVASRRGPAGTGSSATTMVHSGRIADATDVAAVSDSC